MGLCVSHTGGWVGGWEYGPTWSGSMSIESWIRTVAGVYLKQRRTSSCAWGTPRFAAKWGCRWVMKKINHQDEKINRIKKITNLDGKDEVVIRKS